MLSKYHRRGVSGWLRATLAGLAFLFALPAPAVADTDSAGNVIAARRDAWAERGRARPQLYSKSPIFTGDRLTTNPVGRLQVLFNDDSVLMLAPDSQATITEYVYAGKSGNSFNINLAKGVTNLISGRMVENEPGSMRVETPEITVGVQGTALAVQTGGGISKVMIAHATPGKPTIVVCGEDQRKTYLEESGMVLIMNAEAQCVPEIRRMTADEQFFLRSLSLPLGGPGVADTASPVNQAPAPGLDSPILVAQLPQALQDSDGGSIMQPNIPLPPTQNFAGTYSGTMTGGSAIMDPAISFSGNFSMGVADLTGQATVNSFSAELDMFNNGALSQTQAIRVGTESVTSNPNAAIDANGNFGFRGSEGVFADGLDFQYNVSPGLDAPGHIDINGAINGNNVNFNWGVSDGTPSSPDYGSGTGSGVKTP